MPGTRPESIGVVIPVRDGERWLGEAIESALGQDHRPTETIVVDDGSTDRSAEVAERYEGVRVLREPPRGPGAARNAGVEASRSDLVTFLDADDVMLPAKLSRQLAYLRANPGSDAVMCGQELRIEDGVEDRPWIRGGATADAPDGILPISVLIPAPLARRHPFDPRLTIGEDIDWLMRLREAGVVVGTLHEPLVIRRVHEHNLSADPSEIGEGLLDIVRQRLLRQREDG